MNEICERKANESMLGNCFANCVFEYILTNLVFFFQLITKLKSKTSQDMFHRFYLPDSMRLSIVIFFRI